ncbi:hypothetical protein KP509_04G065900 [Ceratopteris richardii]|uniref:C3H1-type domain-containing protein n=1 Tax=Ceratopteris richardii TaxID=49495 RepID=A0A8T2UXU1_CERRI|nr:hypothetical protein KP509_04G065900 [Ceratopteris richardii]
MSSMSSSCAFPTQDTIHALHSFPQRGMYGKLKRSRGKTVCWPPQDQICQIRLFLSDDAPASVGFMHDLTNVTLSNPVKSDCLNEVTTCSDMRSCLAKRARHSYETMFTMVSDMAWSLPKKFIYAHEWQVAKGNDSNEVASQKGRELRVLEAVYPRLTSIPDSPYEPAETPMHSKSMSIASVPLIPIEDVEEEVPRGLDDGMKLTSGCPESDNSSGSLIYEKRLQRLSVPPSSSSGLVDGSLGSSFTKEGLEAAVLAAASVLLHKYASKDLADLDLLLELLKKPSSLLEMKTLVNQPSTNVKDVSMNVTRIIQSQHQLVDCEGTSLKNCTLSFSSVGLPSSASVSPDWNQKEIKVPAILPANLTEMHSANHHSSDWKQEKIKVPSLLPTNLTEMHSANYHPSKDYSFPTSSALTEFHCPLPSTENVQCSEWVRPPDMHTRAHQARIVNNASCELNVSAQQLSNEYLQSPTGADEGSSYMSRNANISIETKSIHLSSENRVHQLNNTRAVISTTLHHGASLRGNEKRALFSALSAGAARTAKLCMFFNTPRGCRYGDNCAYVHQSVTCQEINAFAQ